MWTYLKSMPFIHYHVLAIQLSETDVCIHKANPRYLEGNNHFDEVRQSWPFSVGQVTHRYYTAGPHRFRSQQLTSSYCCWHPRARKCSLRYFMPNNCSRAVELHKAPSSATSFCGHILCPNDSSGSYLQGSHSYSISPN